ncbi:MAG: metallophosphoesterase family protein [Acidimicrobiales bacterium]
MGELNDDADDDAQDRRPDPRARAAVNSDPAPDAATTPSGDGSAVGEADGEAGSGPDRTTDGEPDRDAEADGEAADKADGEAAPGVGQTADGDADGGGDAEPMVVAPGHTPWLQRRPWPLRRAAGTDAAGAGPAAPADPSRRTAVWRTWMPRLRTAGFALGGALLAVALTGRIEADVGPFDSTIAARPSLAGQTTVHLAPLGTIVLDTHDWPLAIDLRADQIGLQEAEAIAANPELLERELGDQVADDVRDGLVRLAVRCTLAAIVGGLAGALIARLSWRSAAAGVAIGGLLVACTGAGTAATFDTNAVAEPHYTGLLTAAPAAVGDIETIVDRYGEYRAQLSDLVGNVVTLYLATESLPTFEPDDDTIRILHVSDVHLNPQAFDVMEQLVDQFSIDAIADTGDLVDWGTEPEGQFVDLIGQLDVPYVYVRGNHDSYRTQAAVADQPNAVVLDGSVAEVAGLRFWGIGDPRYTPNKDRPENAPSEQEEAVAFAPEVAEQVTDAEPPEIDLVMVHDERAAADLGGLVPLVLAGHTHEAREDRIDPPSDDDGGEDDGGNEDGGASATDDNDEAQETRLLVEGSTGGAGLRGLQGEEPEPLAASVLYFEPDDERLLAYDRIVVQGFGETGATIARHVLPAPEDE